MYLKRFNALSKTDPFFLVLSIRVKKLSETFPKRHILDSSKLKEFADDIFIFNDNLRKFSKLIENIVGKREIARYEQFLIFPQWFQKTFTADT